MLIDSTQSFTVPGMLGKQPMRMKQAMVMTTEVVRSSSRGATLKMTYDDIRQTATQNGKPVPLPAMGKTKYLNGKALMFDFDPGGKITKIRGLDALYRAMERNADPSTIASLPFLKKMLNEQSLRDLWGLSFGVVFPSKPTAVGQAWAANFGFGQAPLRMKINLRCRLANVVMRSGRRQAKITFGGGGEMAMTGLPSNASFKTDKLTANGTAYFDLDRGWYSDQVMTMNVKGHATMPSQGDSQTARFEAVMRMSSKVVPLR